MPVKKWTETGRAVRWDFGRASTGTRQVCVMFRVMLGDRRGQEHPWYGFLTPDTVERTLRALREAGWVGDKLDRQLDGLGSVDVPITLEEDEGNVRVAWVGAGDGVPIKDRLDDEDLESINRSIVGLIAKSKEPPKPVTGPAAPRRAPPKGSEMPDDDRFA